MRQNPILPGFNPDPSICLVGDDYYIATSTFEWFPGVQIHHSRDLSNWQLITRPLTRQAQLDMRGVPDSGGIWAPDLTYANGRFWLVYTNITRHHGSVKDGMNYLVTADDINGPWSDPVELNASGFDPALFHDDDGKIWLVQMLWDHDPDPSHFAGIAIQQFDPERMILTGDRHLIFEGTDLGLTEGPHIYKRNGWYHLLTAEGGTGYGHACTWARSKNLLGPYETHPQKHILTAKDTPDHPIQRAGHGDIVETPDGRTFLVHLMGRPNADQRCILGRETGIQECEWRDDWLWVTTGPLPAKTVSLPDATSEPAIDYDFSDGLPLDFQWPRSPDPDRLFRCGDAKLTLFGRASLGNWHEQSLIARRQTSKACRTEITISFDPQDEREMAGLTAYYSRHAHYALAITTNKTSDRILRVIASPADSRGGTWRYLASVDLDTKGAVQMAVEINGDDLQFFYALDRENWTAIGDTLDASILSDEASVATGGGCFTGNFVGVFATDMNGHAKPAEISRFRYIPG